MVIDMKSSCADQPARISSAHHCSFVVNVSFYVLVFPDLKERGKFPARNTHKSLDAGKMVNPSCKNT